MTISIIANVICISFLLGIAYNMIMFIQSQRRHYSLLDSELVKRQNKIRIKRVTILTIALPVIIFILYFGKYLLSH